MLESGGGSSETNPNASGGDSNYDGDREGRDRKQGEDDSSDDEDRKSVKQNTCYF